MGRDTKSCIKDQPYIQNFQKMAHNIIYNPNRKLTAHKGCSFRPCQGHNNYILDYNTVYVKRFICRKIEYFGKNHLNLDAFRESCRLFCWNPQGKW